MSQKVDNLVNAFKITENKERFNELNIIPKME